MSSWPPEGRPRAIHDESLHGPRDAEGEVACVSAVRFPRSYDLAFDGVASHFVGFHSLAKRCASAI